MNAGDLQRAVPHAIEAEQSVLGGLMLDNDAIDRLGDLQREDFYRADHRAIFDAAVSLIAAGVAVDPLTLADHLDRQGKAEQVGGLVYLNALAQNTPSAANVEWYARIVRDRARKRALLTIAADAEATVLANHNGDDADTLLDRTAARIEALAEGHTRREPQRASDGLQNHLDVLERRAYGMECVIATGFADLDRALNGGLRPGWDVILAARPGMGKTALALNIATHVARGHSVLFLSLEMPEAELHDRTLASLGGIALDTVMRSPELDESYWARIKAAYAATRDLNLFIDDQPALRLLDVRAKARLVKRRHGLDLLVLDYLQLMTGEGANRNVELEGISRGLKALAKELGIAVLALAQLNRQVEQRANRIPVLSDLRDSGSLEQDADAVLFLHREEVSNPDCDPQWRGFAQLRIAKFRHGRTGDVPLTYQGQCVRFVNHAGLWPSVTKCRAGFQ